MSEATDSTPPDQVRLSRDKRRLTLVHGERETGYDAEYLRVQTRSAEARGHSPSQAKTVYGKRNVAVVGIEPVGNYAIRLTFDDGHDSGLYAWTYLAELARERDRIWSDYLAELDAKGLTRDPPFAT